MATTLIAQHRISSLTSVKIESTTDAVRRQVSLSPSTSVAAKSRLRSTGVVHGKPMGIEPHINLNEISEEEKQKLVDAAAKKIERELKEREATLKQDAMKAHWDHELNFGKLMFDQGKYDTAMSHFEKILKQAGQQTYHHGEATLQKAACLDKLGREAESKALYESLIQFRAPYPNIKRRAAQALFGADEEQSKDTAPLDDYMYQMFLSGFGHYVPKTKYVETKQEKMAMQILPWTMLAMAPILLVYLLLQRGN